MKVLIICRGPIADEALRVIQESELAKPHILISRREWLDQLETQAPWLHDWSRFEKVHLVDEYSDMDAIIGIVQGNQLDAVYPGYGFLAENAVFAKKCEDAGVCFIGPDSKTMELMALKDRARGICQEIGIPVTPGIDSLEEVLLEKTGKKAYDALKERLQEKNIEIADLSTNFAQAVDQGYAAARKCNTELFTEDELILAACDAMEELWKKHDNMPIRIKASAGGGGKGQRVVSTKDEVAKAMREVWNEIGDDSKAVILEANIERARHMEVQILGDGENVVHFAIRDCSLQTMFYQKLIEIGVHEGQIDLLLEQFSEQDKMYAELQAEKKLIQNLQEAAVKIGKHIGYSKAGTVEFLVDEKRNFYFMEVNARIQVEHGVSEEITKVRGRKLRLIAEQIRIANGEKLGYTQEDIKFSGYSVELRVSLLDSFSLSPAPGAVIENFFFESGENIRIEDSGIAAALRSHREVVSPAQYDANISLNIYNGNTYEEMLDTAIANLQSACISGKDFNLTIPFHLAVLSWLRKNTPLPHVTTDFVGIHLCLLRALRTEVSKIQEEANSLAKQHKRNPSPCLALIKQIIDKIMEDPSLVVAFMLQKGDVSCGATFLQDIASRMGISLWIEDALYISQIQQFQTNLTTLVNDFCVDDLQNETANEKCQELVKNISEVESKNEEEILSALRSRYQELFATPSWDLMQKLLKVLNDLPHNQLYKLPGEIALHIPENLRDKKVRQQILQASEQKSHDSNHIVSPILGIYYSRPKPTEDKFVEVGQTVKVGQTMFLVGAMKVYTEVQSPRNGKIKEILVEEGALVKQGQPVIVLE